MLKISITSFTSIVNFEEVRKIIDTRGDAVG